MLHTHDDFLTAIQAAPADRALRLVYADWLDDHADPRGELVRVEEEMRELPVFTDRFWELKPRRNALRTQVGADWCGRMRYGTECEPVFRHGIPDGWRERWRLIREFTERWHRVPMGDVGGRQAEIAETESRLGRTLPPSVREWIAIAEELRTAKTYRAVLQDIEPRGFPQQRAITLSDYGGGPVALFCGISDADLSNPDPALRCYHEDNGVLDWCDAERIAESVTGYILQDWLPWMFSGFNGFTTVSDIPHHLLTELTATFPPPVVVRSKDFAQEFYEVDNILVRQVITFEPRPGQQQRYVSVVAFKQLPGDQIPPILWKLARFCPSPHGTFAPENRPGT